MFENILLKVLLRHIMIYEKSKSCSILIDTVNILFLYKPYLYKINMFNSNYVKTETLYISLNFMVFV